MMRGTFINFFRLYTLVIAVFGCTTASVCAQNQQSVLKDQFTAYNQQVLQEKIYVHTDKNFYLAGEICWFKIYNTDAFFNKPLGVSKVAYVEVLDKNNKPVLQSKIALENGDGNGSLQWPGSLLSGKYKLRAYTNWMKNFNKAYFFEKTITIINPRKIYDAGVSQQKPVYDIQFFPEGGNLVVGLESKIAFKIIDRNGKGQSCTGVIVNEKADTVGRYATLKFGMGNFIFTPAAGHTYKAITALPDGSHFIQDLPQVYTQGYVMRFAEAGSDQLKITVQSNIAASGRSLYLFAHTRGSVKSVMANAFSNGNAEFLVNAGILGDGISHFTVFTEERQPVCERIYFKKPVHMLGIAAASDKETYEQRTKVKIGIGSADETGKQASANMSLAIYRVDSLTMPESMDISNYLWLSSDLTGNVESPDYYFGNKTAEVAEATDNLMLTQGWRRFRWEDILQHKTPLFEFAPEYKGHILKGRVVNNSNGQPSKGSECFLSIAGLRSRFRGETSDDSGMVKFVMDNFYGNNEIIIQLTASEDSLKHVEMISPYAAPDRAALLPEFSLPEKNAASLQNQNISVQVQNAYLRDKFEQFTEPGIDTFPFYVKPDASYLLDNYVRFTTIEEVLREYVPDVNVRRRDGKFVLPVFDLVRKEFFTVDPLVLLDGVPVLDINKLMRYDPLKIRKLDVVARMYFYGDMYFGGIVNFITYKGDLQGYELDPHTTVLDYETLQLQREFYSPVYETQEQAAGRLPDFRTLLYWSPTIKTNNGGKKEIEFYTSDMPGRFAAVIQGITANGKTGSKTIFFTVKEDNALAGKN